VRLERQSVGTLIQNGSITTGHITAAGISGTVITAGTITGSQMNANFIDSAVFSTVPDGGGAFIEINGQEHTVTSHLNGPWFRVNDGTRNRVLIGQLQSAWGLWITDSSGKAIFSEASLGTSVISTGNVNTGGQITGFAITNNSSTFTSAATIAAMFTVSITAPAAGGVCLDVSLFWTGGATGGATLTIRAGSGTGGAIIASGTIAPAGGTGSLGLVSFGGTDTLSSGSNTYTLCIIGTGTSKTSINIAATGFLKLSQGLR
jgi:hypothetical protein